jgi:general secretion pathway protein M
MAHPAIQQIKDAWEKLGSRERLFASALLAGAGLLTLYLAFLLPVQRDLARLRTQVPKEFEQLQWMRAQAPLAQQWRGRTQTTAPANLPGTLEQSAAAAGIKPQITSSDGGRNLQVSVDSVSFNVLAAWLSDLQLTHGVIIEDATIDAQTAPGMVNARLRLRAGSA